MNYNGFAATAFFVIWAIIGLFELFARLASAGS